MVKVSVIVPIYNAEKYLRETIDSVLVQTYGDFELIAINDGSKDATLERLNDIKNKSDLHIQVLDQENAGVSTTRNRGIAAASGEYLLFLDADDIYNRHFVSALISAVEDGDIDCAYCKLSRDLEYVRSVELENYSPVKETQSMAMQKLLFEMGSYGFYCYIYRRSLIVDNHIEFDVKTKYFEDREFNWKYLCLCRSYAWIDHALYGYRANGNSALNQAITWKRCADSLNAVRRIEAFLDECGCEYAGQVKDYLYARVMWGVAKNVALSGDKKMFAQLISEYDVKRCMRRTAKDSNKIVALASVFYCLHPHLFWSAVRIKR